VSEALAGLFAPEETAPPEFRPGNLEAKFVAPPFTVLDTRQGYWQERRRAWLSLGLQSELGRSGQLIRQATERKGRGADYDLSKGENAWGGSGTSIFDPVLCELALRWWAPEGGRVLDPFAGGSVRGLVAAKLGHPYTGIDLAAAQLEANRAQAAAILAPEEPQPLWLHGDTVQVLPTLEAQAYDMVLTCPPYHDLEVYSSDPADLSNVPWGQFVELYAQAMAASARLLRPERFAVWVVSEIRDPAGYCRGLVPLTIQVAEAAGLRLYNEAILVNSAGSLPLRVTRYMEASRKLGRMHQNVLCFVKGSPPRGWSYDRTAPASPQLGLFEEEPELQNASRPETHLETAPPELQNASRPATHLETAPPAAAPTRPLPTLEEALATAELTPVEVATLPGTLERVWLKRDDTFEVAGVRGGKVRTCWRLATAAGAVAGLVTAGSRSSPQAMIVAAVAQELGVPARLHMPAGEPTEEQRLALEAGALIVPHRPGHNSVIVARAREDARERGWLEIPFGMECQAAVEATAEQVANVPPEVVRIVVPVGSGMTLAGILHGLERRGWDTPVLGIVVGADPTKRLDRWAPADWRERVELLPSGTDYHEAAGQLQFVGVPVDAHYEAKAAAHVRGGDLLWLVGLRASQAAPAQEPPPDDGPSEPAPGRPAQEPPAPAPAGPEPGPAAPGPLSAAIECVEVEHGHPPGYHATQAEADECSAETMGEAGWAAGEEPEPPAELVQLEDGRLADLATGEILPAPELAPTIAGVHTERRTWASREPLPVHSALPAPMPQEQWELRRGKEWSPGDKHRPCWTCGRPPTGVARDGGPEYDHSHNAEVLRMFASDEEAQP
jgi:hypothetical protein